MSEQARITYNAVPNKRAGSGFLPLIAVNGWPYGSTWAGSGYDRDEALEQARLRAEAKNEQHYAGAATVEHDPTLLGR